MAIKLRNKKSVVFNMASMTDLVFLLLIFFVITSTLVSPYALKVLLPQSNSKTTGKQTCSVSISPELQYYVNAQKVEAVFLESELKKILSASDQPGIILHADKSIPLEYAVKVMDIANRNRYQLVLATSPVNE